MITSLSGTIKYTESQFIVVDVAGVGFGVFVPNDCAFSVGQPASLAIHFHWNQENGPQLFGFMCQPSKSAFSLIISCSGIGPKIALAVLGSMAPQQFFQAILLADVKALSAINGIGAKKAELMIMQLKDKVAKLAPQDLANAENSTLSNLKQVSDALSSLNYSRHEVNAALDFVKKSCEIEKSSFDELLRKGLSYLAKRI